MFDIVTYWFAEFDALTGCKIASIDIGSPAVRMLYSPTSSNAVVAILEVNFLKFYFRGFVFNLEY